VDDEVVLLLTNEVHVYKLSDLTTVRVIPLGIDQNPLTAQKA
jgi:hypothetical protein